MRSLNIYRAPMVFFALMFCSLSLSTTALADYPWPDFPLESTGELGFSADGVIFLNQANQEIVYFYLSLREEHFVCREIQSGPDSSLTPQMEIEAQLRFLSQREKVIVQRGTELTIPCYSDSMQSEQPKRFVYLNSPIDPGTAGFEVSIIDKNASREGLVYQIKSEKKRGITRGNLEWPDTRDFGAISGILMLWNTKDESAFSEVNGYELCDADLARSLVEANPMGSYGLYRDHISIYCELYGLGGKSCTFRLRTIALNDSTILLDSSKNLEIPHNRCAVIKNLGISNLPAGSYKVELEVLPIGERDRPLLATHKFQVQWRQNSWAKSQKERVEEAMILLETDEWERFRNLDPGSQESWLQKFWRTHEGSAGPYLQEKFHKRVALADQLFRSSDRGALTDQGRVFVRFGEPDDITKELNPQEEDWIYNYLNRAISQDEADYVGGRPKRNPNDHSSYIVWDYINRGDPILPHWGTTSGGHSLKFIFLDDHGTGYYRLIYSTLFGGF